MRLTFSCSCPLVNEGKREVRRNSLVELPVDVLLLLDDLLGVVHLLVQVVGHADVPLLSLCLGNQLRGNGKTPSGSKASWRCSRDTSTHHNSAWGIQCHRTVAADISNHQRLQYVSKFDFTGLLHVFIRVSYE